ncbi:MAG: tetratricopeptide repeat protein [Candidatus Sumerlaea chitinivorans]|nr:tetratricopeptide repeat protein [Candidatus Sumerlaea chitinivorans]
MKRQVALFGLALGLACLVGWADVLKLTDGRTQEGIIIKDIPGDATITIRTASGDIAIPRDKIASLQRESAAESYAHIGRQYFEKNELQKAYEAYQKARELDPNNTTVTEALQQVEAALEAKASARQREALARVDEAIARARQLAAEKKFDEAAKLLKSVDPGENSPKTGPYRRAYAEVYLLWGMDRLDRQDFGGAQEKFQIALKLDPRNEKIRQQLVRVWEGDPAKLNEVINFYKNSTLPEDQLKVADALFKLKRYDEALPIYLKYAQEPRYASETIRQRIYVILDQLHRQYAEKGDYAKAIEAYKLFMEYSPNEPPTPLAKYEYMMRRSKIDPNNAKERAELAAFAEQVGLAETAREEYLNVLRMDPSNKVATEGLRRFAEADLQDARDFLNEQQFMLAQSKAEDVKRNYAYFPDIVKQADELIAKAQVEQKKIQENVQKQAVALALRGDDYYNQALAYISTYMSTNVDRNVRVFSPKVEAAKYLQRAIYAWQSALKLDSSLGAPTSYDLYNKIADATAKYAVLTNPYPPRRVVFPGTGTVRKE